MRIAIQGEQGSFHQVAAEEWFGQNIELVCCDTFDAAFEALQSGLADSAVIAIENSLAGSLHRVYDLLLKTNVHIVGEIYQHIHQCLIGFPETSIDTLTRIYSQPIALAQCMNYLSRVAPNAKLVEYHDTSASVMHVKEQNDPKFAAIAGKLAAEVTGLTILDENIEDNHRNFTRFLVLSTGKNIPANANKTSLVLETSHKPGALQAALKIFSDMSLNLRKLESRPIPHEPWHYQFFIDIEVAGPQLDRCIKALNKQDCQIRILGQYVSNIDLDADI